MRKSSSSDSCCWCAYSSSWYSQKRPCAAADSLASAAACAIGWRSRIGKWRNAKRRSSPMRSRTRRTTDCEARQYGHWKSPNITSSSGASAFPRTWSSASTGGVRRVAATVPRSYAPMGDVQSLLLLLIFATVLVRLADIAGIPSPIVLVLGGLGIALVPGMPDIILPPETIFLVFLPPLVHSAGWYSSPQELRAIVRPLAVLAVALVFATGAAVAVVVHELVPGMDWA